MGKELDRIRTTTHRRGGCRYCGEDTAATIEIRVREVDDEGKRVQVAGMTAVACDAHAANLYEDLIKQVTKTRR